MRLSILIPIYNERATVSKILDQILAQPLPGGLEKELILIESGSADGTRRIVEGYRSRPGVKIIYEDRPRGKGAALRRAIPEATGEILLIQDADLEYTPEDYPAVLEPILSGRADAVYGSRILGHGHWQFRKYKGIYRLFALAINVGGLLYTKLFNLLYGARFTDAATMYKVVKADILKSFHLTRNYFDLDWEITAKLVKAGCRIEEVPVRYSARSHREGKKIRFFRDGLTVFWSILRFRFSA
ncbi:MAG: glycosyltransferase family 2 protein [Elusimicrobia bacterium]|nr:glycosyltransferase family 2 protein [Elusimicrobiota bacterium]